MLNTIASACVFAMLALSTVANLQASVAAHRLDQGEARSPRFSADLVGTWKAAPDEMKLTSAFDESVWGRNATSVRTVELQVDPSGAGTLRILKKVVDARGRTVAASTSMEEVKLQLGESRNTASVRVEHGVNVVSAVRTYPDDPGYRWELPGLRVQIVTFADGDRH